MIACCVKCSRLVDDVPEEDAYSPGGYVCRFCFSEAKASEERRPGAPADGVAWP